LLLRRQGNLDGAIEHYRRALATQPNSYPARMNLGSALFAKHNLQEAAQELKAAIALKPDSPASHDLLAHVLFEMKDPNSALEEWKRAAHLDGYNADTLVGMSIAHWQLGQKTQALNSYRSAVFLDRGYVCDHLKEQGHWKDPALEVLRQVKQAAGPTVCAGS